MYHDLQMKNSVTVAVPLIIFGSGHFLSLGQDLFAREGPDVEGGCSIQKRKVPSFESSSVGGSRQESTWCFYPAEAQREKPPAPNSNFLPQMLRTLDSFFHLPLSRLKETHK